MAKLRYLIRRLPVQAMLSYAKPNDHGTYSFALTPAQTKSIIMGDGETWQEDNAIFFQAMCILRGEKYKEPTPDILISDLAEVIFYPKDLLFEKVVFINSRTRVSKYLTFTYLFLCQILIFPIAKHSII